MTTSMSAGSKPVSSRRDCAALTERSLTCSSSAAMCLPRSPNFSITTFSGMPLRSPTSAAVIHRSGRYPAVAASDTLVTYLQDAANDARELLLDVHRHLAVAPEDEAHAEQLARRHERPRGDLGI